MDLASFVEKQCIPLQDYSSYQEKLKQQQKEAELKKEELQKITVSKDQVCSIFPSPPPQCWQSTCTLYFLYFVLLYFLTYFLAPKSVLYDPIFYPGNSTQEVRFG